MGTYGVEYDRQRKVSGHCVLLEVIVLESFVVLLRGVGEHLCPFQSLSVPTPFGEGGTRSVYVCIVGQSRPDLSRPSVPNLPLTSQGLGPTTPLVHPYSFPKPSHSVGGHQPSPPGVPRDCRSKIEDPRYGKISPPVSLPILTLSPTEYTGMYEGPFLTSPRKDKSHHNRDCQ